MRRITLWMLSTVAALVLLFSYRTSTDSPAVASTTAVGGSGGDRYTGATASTRWGDVQVQITVANGKITSVSVPVYPTGNRRDQAINAEAIPALVQATLQAQSAKIDTVSGATVTSDGYLESLQSALDQAHTA